MTLNYWTYDPKKVVGAHCKKENFSWSYSHAKQDHEDGIKNLDNATRELIPSEQHAREDDLLNNSQEDVSLKKRSSTINKNQHKAPKGTGESEKQNGKRGRRCLKRP